MAFCIHCGNKLEDGLKFCTNCGAKIDNVLPRQIVQPPSIQPVNPQYKPVPPPVYNQQSEVVIHNATKKGDDVSVGFGKAFGETTGRAFGCFVIAVAVIAVFVLIAFFSFR